MLAPATTFGFPLPASIGVIHRVPDHASAHRAFAKPNRSASFTKNNVFPLRIANLTNRRQAFFVNSANFTRRQSDLSVTSISRHQSRE
jgi:hypothetical protein